MAHAKVTRACKPRTRAGEQCPRLAARCLSGEAIALAHAADSRVQHGENKRTKTLSATCQETALAPQAVRRGVGRTPISIQRLEVQQEIADGGKARDADPRGGTMQ
jgi:hypothetical protein